jgi:flavin-dependent dehydrogenase
VVTRNPAIRLEQALREMPVLAKRLAGARAIAQDRGAPCALRRLRTVSRGRLALIGDASGSVDPITGEGLGIAFRQALALAAALRAGDLQSYQIAHRRIGRTAHIMSRLILIMDRSRKLQQRALRGLAGEPRLFGRLLNVQVQDRAPSLLELRDALRLGWRLAVPGRPQELSQFSQ